MKTSAYKRLYVLLINTGLFITTTDAQIVYTDIKPDAKFTCSKAGCSHQYNLDLNNDGINDFTLSVVSEDAGLHCRTRGNNSSVSITQLNSNEVVGFNYAYKLPSDTIIDAHSTYYDTLGSGTVIQLEYFRWWYVEHQGCNEWKIGYWPLSTDGYVGLKLKKSELIYYGWARLSVSVSSISASFTIKDYAYNSVPNQPILAGEKSCTSPSVTLSANGPLSFCSGDSVILTANGTGYLYQWKKNGKNIKGATAQTYVAKAAGTYKCKVTNSCGSKTSEGDTVTISSINSSTTNEAKISNNTHIKVAPNPFSNSTTISFTLSQSQKVSLQIFDMNGRLIKTLADEEMQARNHQLTWNAKDEKGNAVVAGIYLLKMQVGNYVETKKVVMMK